MCIKIAAASSDQRCRSLHKNDSSFVTSNRDNIQWIVSVEFSYVGCIHILHSDQKRLQGITENHKKVVLDYMPLAAKIDKE